MREAFALQKLLTSFQQQKIGILEILAFEIFYELITNNVISFEQLGPGFLKTVSWEENL